MTFNPNLKPLVLSLCKKSHQATWLKNPSMLIPISKGTHVKHLSVLQTGVGSSNAAAHLHPHSFVRHGGSWRRRTGESLATVHYRLVEWISLMPGLLLKKFSPVVFLWVRPPPISELLLSRHIWEPLRSWMRGYCTPPHVMCEALSVKGLAFHTPSYTGVHAKESDRTSFERRSKHC